MGNMIREIHLFNFATLVKLTGVTSKDRTTNRFFQKILKPVSSGAWVQIALSLTLQARKTEFQEPNLTREQF